MSPRQFASNPLIQLLVMAVTLGIAWGTLKMEVNDRVTHAELKHIADSLGMIDRAQIQTITEMSTDIRTIRAVICAKEVGDSYCSVRFPKR